MKKLLFHLKMMKRLPVRYWPRWFKQYALFKKETLDRWDEIEKDIIEGRV